MKHFSKFLVLAALGSVLLLGGASKALAADDGPTIFKKNECNNCHSVSSAGIAVVDAEKGAKLPPDLSGAGVEHDAIWMTKFLKKEIKLNGKDHRKKFKGEAADLEVLTKWLETLKTKK